MNTNLNVVVLAAGMGSRMKSKLAKVLHRAGGMPLAEHVVRSDDTRNMAVYSPSRNT